MAHDCMMHAIQVYRTLESEITAAETAYGGTDDWAIKYLNDPGLQTLLQLHNALERALEDLPTQIQAVSGPGSQSRQALQIAASEFYGLLQEDNRTSAGNLPHVRPGDPGWLTRDVDENNPTSVENDYVQGAMFAIRARVRSALGSSLRVEGDR